MRNKQITESISIVRSSYENPNLDNEDASNNDGEDDDTMRSEDLKMAIPILKSRWIWYKLPNPFQFADWRRHFPI